MVTITTSMTAEELLCRPDDGLRHELIAGELTSMTPSGSENGDLVGVVTGSLQPFVHSQRLGRVRAGEPGFVLARDPDTVRAPDVAFISQARLTAAGRVTGYWEGAPDLAVEVISPNDLYTEVEAKVAMWLTHGTRMVLVVNPRQQTVTVHRPGGARTLGVGETLSGEEVVPGWALPLADLFADPTASAAPTA